jgi:hypothetical protein
VVNQVPAKDGPIPLEILRPVLSSTAPNQIEDVSYVLRNNTSKGISAVVVKKSITYEEGGVPYTNSAYGTLDYALHPDIGGAKLFAPGNETPMDSAGPLRFDDDVVVKEIRLQVDYVLFDDNTALGSGGQGEKNIGLMREGARKYKEWLVQRYNQSGKSLATILPLLQGRSAQEELGLTDINQSLGADRYRLHLLKTLQTRGPADVEKYVKR